jgi:hypothetical protein
MDAGIQKVEIETNCLTLKMALSSKVYGLGTDSFQHDYVENMLF